MGRKKIEIKAIFDRKSKKDTFHKRKIGLVKKAAELSMLCNLRMLLVFEDLAGEVIKYSTHGVYDPAKYFNERYNTTPIAFTAQHYPDFFKSDLYKNRLQDHEEDEVDEAEEENEDLEGNRSSEESCPRVQHSLQKEGATDRLLLNMSKIDSQKTLISYEFFALGNNELGLNPLFNAQTLLSHTNAKKSSDYIFQNLQKDLKIIREQEELALSNLEFEAMNFKNHYHKILSNLAPEMQIEDQFKPEFKNFEVPTRTSFKDPPKLKLKITKEEDDDEIKAPSFLPNKFFSPNLFTASPIPHIGVSPMKMNQQNFLYEFNDTAMLNRMHTPSRVKDSHFQGELAQSKDTVKSHQDQLNARVSQPRRPDIGYSKFNFGENLDSHMDFSNQFSARKTPKIKQEREIYERPAQRVFNYRNINNIDETQAKEEEADKILRSNQFSKLKVKEEEGSSIIKNEVENSGMHMFFPVPLSSVRRNSINSEWVKYFMQEQLDRPEREDLSFLNTSKLSAISDSDRSLSIAKSPNVVKKVKEN